MDIRKLQRAIVDGLEDVKAQDIVVFNTEHLSPLFERVIIATGSSNRQTKALASGVRESVKAAGFPVLATEGGDNGEWIIVDCGAAVAHVMQPAIREYYRLEEIWGGKPVKMKLGAAKTGLVKASEPDDDEARWRERKVAARKAAPEKASAGPAKKAAAGAACGAQAAARAAIAAKAAEAQAAAPRAAASRLPRKTALARRARPQGDHRRQASRRPPVKTAAGRAPAKNRRARRRAAADGACRRMKLLLVAGRPAPPAWAETAYDDFAKRFPPDLRLELKAVKAEPRTGKTAVQLMAAEAQRIEAALPKGVRRVVLDEHGTRLTTCSWRSVCASGCGDGRDVPRFVVGGPDGLDPAAEGQRRRDAAPVRPDAAARLRARAAGRGALPCLVGARTARSRAGRLAHSAAPQLSNRSPSWLPCDLGLADFRPGSSTWRRRWQRRARAAAHGDC
jgi:ribosome-associated protein